MLRRTTPILVLLTALTLSACSGPATEKPAVDVPPPPVEGVDAPSDDAFDGADDGRTDALAHITSCDQVAALTGGLTDGLELVDPSVDEWGFQCLWETAAADDLAEVRSIEVGGQPFDQRGSMTTVEIIEAGGLLTHIPDPALENAGGIAYSLRLGDVVSALAVTVQVPDAQISVSGAGWAATGGLDESGAVGIARSVLGL
ncbi:hypothetical protein [Cellulomonas chengniuliangii]|uniref:DUF3558 domain-containing protein n=1 Tax=Cellulomonas chengniuliangii TaxID=2968084 RepID=A0ABY5L0U2_9CELL|nr:hypothetical protein [Cellulomonas chengniuliangii]MCC2307526.1 hypothetical protein [Cellulomonas chengniuliangii]UUI75703.1 hypothetical protein NP064_01920 [Cellulomonas chengniuliangii]